MLKRLIWWVYPEGASKEANTVYILQSPLEAILQDTIALGIGDPAIGTGSGRWLGFHHW